MVLTVDLTKSFFQHAVLFVGDLGGGATIFEPTGPYYFENVRVYVGDSPDYLLNVECAGGPFLVSGDSKSYVNVSYPRTGFTGSFWKYGEEVWCNLQGRYTTLVSDMSHKAGQTYTISLCQLGVMAAIYVRSTPAPTTFIIVIGSPSTFSVAKISADPSYPIGNTLNIQMRQKAGSELSWVTFTDGVDATTVNVAPNRSVTPGVYTLVLESFDQAGGVFSTLKTDTISVTVNSGPPSCLVGLTQSVSFETTKTIELIQEYQPTVFYPEHLFTGPHTNTGYSCGGDYTQSITINTPVTGVVITDQPTGQDLRPRLAIASTAPAATTFTLTFNGRYVHSPTSTDITSSFTQTYTLKSVFSTAYLDQPTITHSLTSAQLTFAVPPAAPGVVPPTQTLAISQFTVAYSFKAGTQDSLGNTPPTIAPVPYTGYTSAEIVKGQSTLGTTTLTSPKGSMTAVGFSGDLNAGSSLQFQCDPWSVSNKGTSVFKTLTFRNSIESAFTASLQVTCTFGLSNPPYFASALSTQSITSGIAKTWTLPLVTDGHLTPTTFRFETATAVTGFMSFAASTRTVSYNGNQFGSSFASSSVTIVLIDSAAQESPFTQTLTILPVQCGQALAQSVAFETTQPIMLIQEYQPTVYFPQPLFNGPHTFTSYACGGDYTQSITINTPVTGVVITDQPTGQDLRPRLAIASTAPAATTFTLTFNGRYIHSPTSTDITSSFTQTYTLKSVFSTAYLDQPTITHSLTSAQLTFTVPPAAPGVVPPTQTLASSQFTVAYSFKAGTQDSLGNTPPTIAPVPYSGFTSAEIVKGQSTLGTTTLTSPKGVLNSSGFTGNLSTGTVSFACDAWTKANQGKSIQTTLNFVNSEASAFMASLDVTCAFQPYKAPAFEFDLPKQDIRGGVATSWTLPVVLAGSFAVKQIKFEPDKVVSDFFTFKADSREVFYDGNMNIAKYSGTLLKAKVSIQDDLGIETVFEQTLSVMGCSVGSNEIDALAEALAAEPLRLSLIAHKVGFTQLVYKDKQDRIVEKLAMNVQNQMGCGAITIDLVTKHSFLTQLQESQGLILTANGSTEPAIYEDSYLRVKGDSFSFKIPIRAEFVSCIVTKLSFRQSTLDVSYLVGSGSLKTDLPRVVQSPDCGLTFANLFIKGIYSRAIATELVQDAVKLNSAKNAIVVATSDPAFIGKKVAVTVSILAPGIDYVLDLVVQLRFEDATGTKTADKSELERSAPTTVKKDDSADQSQNPPVAAATVAASPRKEIELKVDKNLGAELGIRGFVAPLVTEEQEAIIKTPATKLTSEQLFSDVPLAARLTAGVEQLNEFRLQQREALKKLVSAEVAAGKPRPTEARFESFSASGELKLKFTNSIKLPKGFNEHGRRQLQLSAGEGFNKTEVESMFQLMAVPGVYEKGQAVAPILESWELVALREDEIEFKIHFENALRVSSDDVPDWLVVQLMLSKLKDENGSSFPESLVKFILIPRQMASEAEAAVIQSAGDTAQSAMLANLALNALIALSADQLWSIVNNLQIEMVINLFDTKTPGNVNEFNEFIAEITSVKGIEMLTEGAIDYFFYFPEQDSKSANFQNAGYDQPFFVKNAQSMFAVKAFFVCLLIAWVVLWLPASCSSRASRWRQRLTDKLFWNGFIRLLMESYADISLLAIFNLKEMEWPENDTTAVTFNNRLTWAFIGILIGGPLILFFHLCRKHDLHVAQDESFNKRYGAFLEGTSPERDKKWVVFLVPVAFFAKRLSIGLTLVLWADFFCGQIAIQLVLTTGMIIFIQQAKPYETHYANNLETFNEVFTLMIQYFLLMFTDFVPDPEMRHLAGTGYIASLAVFLAINIYLLFRGTVHDSKVLLRLKRCLYHRGWCMWCFASRFGCLRSRSQKRPKAVPKKQNDLPLVEEEKEERKAEAVECVVKPKQRKKKALRRKTKFKPKSKKFLKAKKGLESDQSNRFAHPDLDSISECRECDEDDQRGDESVSDSADGSVAEQANMSGEVSSLNDEANIPIRPSEPRKLTLEEGQERYERLEAERRKQLKFYSLQKEERDRVIEDVLREDQKRFMNPATYRSKCHCSLGNSSQTYSLQGSPQRTSAFEGQPVPYVQVTDRTQKQFL